MKTATIVAIGVVVALVLSIGVYVFLSGRNAPTTMPPKPPAVTVAPPLVPVQPKPTPAPTPAPTTAPPPAVADVIYVPEYRYGLAPLPPPPPPGWVAHGYVPTVELVPGAAWPSLVGRNRDTAVSYVMTTYPRLTVRALPYGTAVKYTTRTDRLTILYDPSTRRVVTARLG